MGRSERKIIGVAIKSAGVVYWMRAPGRHATLGKAMILSGHPRPFPGGDAQGFILEDEITFVGRKDAAKIVLANGQCSCLIAPPNLYSEDLW